MKWLPSWLLASAFALYKLVFTISSHVLKNLNYIILLPAWASLMAQMVKNLPAMRETQVWSLGWDYLLKGKATHSSILAWKIPWTEEPGWLQSMGSQGVQQDWETNTFTFITNKTARNQFLHICGTQLYVLLTYPNQIYLMKSLNKLSSISHYSVTLCWCIQATVLVTWLFKSELCLERPQF